MRRLYSFVMGMFLAGALFMDFSLIGQAAGANVTDTVYTVSVTGKYGGFTRVEPRNKYNSTKVYVKIMSSPATYLHVQTVGTRNTTAYFNETIGTTATVKKGVQSSISNWIFERKALNYDHVPAAIQLRSTADVGNVYGLWSPDSTKNYTIVN